jgi:hypothetical protein
VNRPKRAVFFTLDGLRSTPQEINFNPVYRRPVYMSTDAEFSVKDPSYDYGPNREIREYEYTKTIEWFDGEPVAYFCEVNSKKGRR